MRHGGGLPLLLKVPICRDQSSGHRLNDFFALLCTDWLGAHGRIFVLLVVKHQHGDQASNVVVIGQQFVPAIVAQTGSPDEAASPVGRYRY